MTMYEYGKLGDDDSYDSFLSTDISIHRVIVEFTLIIIRVNWFFLDIEVS